MEAGWLETVGAGAPLAGQGWTSNERWGRGGEKLGIVRIGGGRWWRRPPESWTVAGGNNVEVNVLGWVVGGGLRRRRPARV